MAKKEQVDKIILEREYIIPLRREWSKVPEYKRANKAAKAIREFLVRHMKVYDRNLDKIKIDINLNNEIRFRGMKKPPAKIKVKAKKYESGIVRTELAEIPKTLQYKLDREKKKTEETQKKKTEEMKRTEEARKAAEKAKQETEAEKKEETVEEKKEKEEKEESTREDGLKHQKQAAKQAKHTSAGKRNIIHRKALAR